MQLVSCRLRNSSFVYDEAFGYYIGKCSFQWSCFSELGHGSPPIEDANFGDEASVSSVAELASTTTTSSQDVPIKGG